MNLENIKVLVVIDCFKRDMFDGNKLDFWKSKTGKNLYSLVTKKRAGMGLSFDHVDIAFAYPQLQELDRNKTPKPVSLGKLKPFYEKLQGKIRETNPDLVVGFGVTAHKGMVYSPDKTNFALGKESKSEDIVHYTQNGIDSYYAFMPSLEKPSVAMTMPDKDKMTVLMRQVRRFIREGVDGLKPDLGEYEYFTDFEDVKNLFENILPKQKIVACDFETNTLKTWLPGARMIMFSCSWKDKQGVSIPLDHMDEHPWTEEQNKQIFEWIGNLISSKQYKVFHNAQFDIRAMFDQPKFKCDHAVNVLDTMIFYYVGYTESKYVSRGLKFLAKKYTDLGDYEKPRDEYFAKMQKNRYDYWYKAEEERLAKEAEETGKKPKKPKKSDYVPRVNEVDGSNMNFEWLPLSILAPYASIDTDATLRLLKIFAKRVATRDKWVNLCYSYYPKLVDSICYMEHCGAYFDSETSKTVYHRAYQSMKNNITDEMYAKVPEIKEYEQHRLDQLAQRERIKKIKPADRTPEQKAFFTEIAKINGKDSKGVPKYKFTPSSGDKLGYILYNMLGYELPPEKEYLKPASIKKKGLLSHPENITWDDYKADSKSSLPYLVEHYGDNLAKLVMRYNEIDKILGTYVDALPELACDNYIHANFNILGTQTSRLSSSSPNLQNQPKPSHNPNDLTYQYPIKGLYKSRFNGGYIFNFDYKSLEVFLNALVSNERSLIQALLDGADVHRHNASIAYGIPEDEVSEDLRSNSKKVTFGLLYSISVPGLAKNLGVSEEEAQETHDKIMSAMPSTNEYIKRVQAFAKRYGYVETLQGTYRRLPEIKYGTFAQQQGALRESFNAVIQGSESVIVNDAIISIREWLRDNNMKSKLILTVHDSIVVDVHPDEVFEVADKVKYTMEHLPLPYLKISSEGYDVPEQWDLGNGKMRFPLFAEPAFGHTYGDDLDWDSEEAKTFPDVETYYNFSMETKRTNDVYNQLVKEASDEQKESLEQKRASELQAIKTKYNVK